jgi:DNA-binding CsgD family transcriptional regulator
MREDRLLGYAAAAAHDIAVGRPATADLVAALFREIGTDDVALTALGARPVTGARSSAERVITVRSRLTSQEMLEWSERHREHPYYALIATGRDPRVCRTTDLMPFSRFSRTALYRDLLLPRDSRFQVGMTLHLTDRCFIHVVLHRRLHDFSDREMIGLERVQPLLAAAYAYRVAADDARSALGAAGHRTDRARVILTPRERQVIELVAAGYTNDQIARRLAITSRTVRKHLGGIFAKVGVDSRSSAVAWWLQPDHPRAWLPRH